MLHLAGGIAFGVDVGNFLQLERAFERDRDMNAAAEEEEVRASGIARLASSSYIVVVREQVFELAGNAQSVPAPAALGSARRHRAARLAEVHSAEMNSAVSWQVNALVEATPISGPAWV